MEMERYAEEHRVPIMQLPGIEGLLQILRVHKPEKILEVGSAIGYSAIRMAEALPCSSIVTIERDPERAEKAREYIATSDYQERIYLIEGDALEVKQDQLIFQQFDAIFIDAAKGQYRRFFDLYAPLLSEDGAIYCDNMYMHGMAVKDVNDIPRKNRTMIRKLKDFTQWILDHPDYHSALLPVGDGLLICTKK
ncbi:O-methyltransferase [Chungangia koreensis]|uniref:O-methyltransferase n=1 Tax=Chungangia koreensis TaxID=752657 RepID=A0ABV8X6K3_9LACT